MQNDLFFTKKCGVVILAAGKSSRMGTPKFGLKFNDKMTFLEVIIQHYKSFGCKEILVILNKEGEEFIRSNSLEIPTNVILVTNTHPELGRFYSIQLGVQNLKQEQSVFIHNVDNPFVDKDDLESLYEQDGMSDYIVPSFKGRGGHPILISNDICQAIISEKEHNLILSDFLKRFKKKKILVNNEKVLVNINTKEIYHHFFN